MTLDINEDRQTDRQRDRQTDRLADGLIQERERGKRKAGMPKFYISYPRNLGRSIKSETNI